MDITEAFRSEDLTKADFFDFVTTPDSNDNQTLQHFSKQMRTVNAFLGNGNSEDGKETNNNNMLTGELTIPVSSSDNNFDPSFWADKDTVRIETAILEDLNKYCWSTDEVTGEVTATSSGRITNTDGHIYTLTVLNGIDQSTPWYKTPVIKEEDGSISSPSSMEHLQAGLDIDSILNIMPASMNGFNGNYNEGTMSPNTDGLIKSEPYTYEDSGFADNKDELANALIIDTPLLEVHDSFNNNNNDWKLTNNNTSNGSPDSLLRSALQGKAFVRYNGNALKAGKSENNAELRRVLSTPPAKTEIYIKEDPDKIPTIVAGIDANGAVIFEEHPPRQSDPDNPTSTHNMDDILLSQLDNTYPEDFEKLKRIANEVAESVNQFCQIDTSVENVYSITPEQIGMLSSLSSPISISTAPVVTSTKPSTKKYKRSNSNSKQTTVQSATSTSNGVRKERSLHYCSICSKGFKDKYSVNVHIRTHTGEKPFACSLCGKSFRQKAHLAKHYQTHIAQKNAAAAGNVATTKTKSSTNKMELAKLVSSSSAKTEGDVKKGPDKTPTVVSSSNGKGVFKERPSLTPTDSENNPGSKKLDDTNADLNHNNRPENHYPESSFSKNSYSENSFAENSFTESSFSEKSFAENSFSEKSFAEGSFPDESFAENTFSEKSFAENNFTENSFKENSFAESNFTKNSFPENSFSQNSYPENGYSSNSFQENSFSDSNVSKNTFPESFEKNPEEVVLIVNHICQGGNCPCGFNVPSG